MTDVRRQRLASPRKKSGYHHDDLRRALLDAALVRLRTGDVTSLTMQQLARAAGVSPGAPYHHFHDKLELIAALAEEGFSLWLEEVGRVAEEAPDARAALLALAGGWVAFAARHPEHYRLMFLPEVGDRRRFASLHATSGKGLTILVELISRCLPRAPPGELLERAVAMWSAVHGFASLRNAGVLNNIPALPPLQSLEARLLRLIASAVDGS